MMPPPPPPLHPPPESQLYHHLRTDLLVASSVSLGCSVALLLLYKALPRTRRTPGWLIARAAVCEIVVSVCFLSLGLYETGPAWLVHNKYLEGEPVLPAMLLASR